MTRLEKALDGMGADKPSSASNKDSHRRFT